MIERKIYADAEQPRAESPRRIELIEPFVSPQKCFLREIAGQFPVSHKPQDDANQPAFIAANELPERLRLTAARILDEARIAPPAALQRLGLRRLKFRVRHTDFHALITSHPIIRRGMAGCWMRLVWT